MKASLSDGFAGRSIVFLILFLSCALAQGQTVVYVSPNGGGNGSSWTQASSLNGAPRVQGASIDMGPHELDPSTITKPDCAVITAPTDGADDVAVDVGINWNAVTNASGYRLYIGTTAGGSEVVDGGHVTGTSFNPLADFEENTTYYVRVIPYNAAGRTTGCAEISFTTETLLTAPICAVITSPAYGAEGVALDASITWNSVADADRYRVFIGTTPGGTEITNGEEVTTTSYKLPAGLEESTIYYATVIPYNDAGAASGCTEISFTTEASKNISRTKYGISPNGDGINDHWNRISQHLFPELPGGNLPD